MIKPRKSIQTISLALGLLLLSGIGIGYNIYTAEDEGLSISVARLAEGWFADDTPDGDAISHYSRANLTDDDAVQVFGGDTGIDRGYELLPPIISQ